MLLPSLALADDGFLSGDDLGRFVSPATWSMSTWSDTWEGGPTAGRIKSVTNQGICRGSWSVSGEVITIDYQTCNDYDGQWKVRGGPDTTATFVHVGSGREYTMRKQ